MIITLTTDFGCRDAYVGSMKGVILSIHPEVRLVDLSHEIPNHDILTASFVLREAYPFFPKGTVHLAVIDPGVGTNRKGIVVEGDGHLFVGPDNGLFTFLLETVPTRSHEISHPEYLLSLESPTFQGRDRFAPAAAWLSKGVPSHRMGPECIHPLRLGVAPPVRKGPIEIEGSVIYIDRFGNLITNLTAQEIGENPSVRIRSLSGQVFDFKKAYAEGSSQIPAALINSSGQLEIFLFKGSAQGATGLKIGDPIVVEA